MYFTLVFSYCLAGNETCPQPQTSEHLAAIEIMRLRHIIILQNKIDIIKESQAQEQYQDIVRFVQGQQLQLRIFIGYFPANYVLHVSQRYVVLNLSMSLNWRTVSIQYHCCCSTDTNNYTYFRNGC